MLSLTRLWRSGDRIDAIAYQRNLALLALGKSLADILALALTGMVAPVSVIAAWLDPCLLLKPLFADAIPVTIGFTALLFHGAVVWNSVLRLRDIGWRTWPAWFTLIPFAWLALVLLFALSPTKRRSIWDLI